MTPEGPTHLNCQCKASSPPMRHTLVVVSRMISLCRSSTTIFTWPSFEARCKPFSPFCKEQRGREGVVSGTVHPACPAVPSGWDRAPSLRRAEGESWRGPEWYQLRPRRAGPASASSSSGRASDNRGAGKEGITTRPPPPRYELSVGSSHKANG